MIDSQEPYSEFWTAMAREVDLWDRCASTLAFVGAAACWHLLWSPGSWPDKLIKPIKRARLWRVSARK